MSSAIFLQKLHSLLRSAPANIISWKHDGSAFAVYDIAALEAQVLPRYFKHSNYASFTRQLRFYGFRRSRCEGVSEFHHADFLRDLPNAMRSMRRKTFHSNIGGTPRAEVDGLWCALSQFEEHMEELTNKTNLLRLALRTMLRTTKPIPVGVINRSVT
ncbi:hypothetical protein ACHHYP_01664 [Achlya hypogyna]|uniref:HSF-type DNA-binding domain-containing protein n=1 Tax=Achlya hypogyna TaxID=1202772 RepID=A0A1V9Z847_ACHHY|nr:hypothetical protein ACHHYP_01664 [Achlya hypogyna]